MREIGSSLQSEVITYIHNYITNHGLKPGDKLPSQAQMIAAVGVSRTTLREAIKTLEAKGVVRTINGKGIYIRENHEAGWMSLMNFSAEKELLLELLEMREILERENLRLVIRNSTEEELDRVGEILKLLMEKYHRGEKQTDIDRKFHNMIYECSHNRFMFQLIQSISDSMDIFWSSPLNMYEPFTDTIPLHEALYYAIRERSVKKAQDINEQIINSIYRTIKNQH